MRPVTTHPSTVRARISDIASSTRGVRILSAPSSVPSRSNATRRGLMVVLTRRCNAGTGWGTGGPDIPSENRSRFCVHAKSLLRRFFATASREETIHGLCKKIGDFPLERPGRPYPNQSRQSLRQALVHVG